MQLQIFPELHKVRSDTKKLYTLTNISKLLQLSTPKTDTYHLNCSVRAHKLNANSLSFYRDSTVHVLVRKKELPLEQMKR